jgi:uncharacterized protein YjbJ (UPF0337 family)
MRHAKRFDHVLGSGSLRATAFELMPTPRRRQEISQLFIETESRVRHRPSIAPPTMPCAPCKAWLSRRFSSSMARVVLHAKALPSYTAKLLPLLRCFPWLDGKKQDSPAAGHHKNSMKGTTMNWDIIEGNWKQFKGKAKEQWGKLTDDTLDVIAGNRDQLAGKVQEAYGLSKDDAEKQIKAFEERNKDYKF